MEIQEIYERKDLTENGKRINLVGKYGNVNQKLKMVAAWLHDIASVTDYSLYEQHHIRRAEISFNMVCHKCS